MKRYNSIKKIKMQHH